MINVLTCDRIHTGPFHDGHAHDKHDDKVDKKSLCFVADNRNHRRCNGHAILKKDQPLVFVIHSHHKHGNTKVKMRMNDLLLSMISISL